jgi:crossover junction endodeoxyribonuclease RusA
MRLKQRGAKRLIVGDVKRLEITVPLVPPSVNHYVKHTRDGRHYVTAAAKAYKQAIAIYSRGKRVLAKQYKVKVVIYLGHRQRGDIDNFLKVVNDGLEEAGVIHSDGAIRSLAVEIERDAENPRTEITVGEKRERKNQVRGVGARSAAKPETSAASTSRSR